MDRKMTSRERVRMTFDNQEPDRVPIFEIRINSPPAEEISRPPARGTAVRTSGPNGIG